MIFSQFTTKTKDYLKSLRYLKDYVSFDLYLKNTWVIPKKFVGNIEVIKQDKSDRPDTNLYSFVVVNDVENVNILETSFDNILNFNLEREEKEKLFKEKIEELKKVFESKDVDSLKRLYFDVNENTSLLTNEDIIEDEQQVNTSGDGEHDVVVQETTTE